MIAATLGLAASLVAVFSALFFRVALRWHDNADMAPTDPARMGVWWRLTWAMLCVGLMPPILAHISYVKATPFFDFDIRVGLTLAGMVILNMAGCMADIGFNLNRGQKPLESSSILLVLVAFVALAMVTT